MLHDAMSKPRLEDCTGFPAHEAAGRRTPAVPKPDGAPVELGVFEDGS